MLKTGEYGSIQTPFILNRFPAGFLRPCLLLDRMIPGTEKGGQSLAYRGGNTLNRREFDTLIIIHLLLIRATMRR